MIPKTIHYCWFGRGPKTPLGERCIASWRRHFPLIGWAGFKSELIIFETVCGV